VNVTRIRLRGLNKTTRTLADGTRRTYWYAWKSGPPLRGKPGTPEFVASYNEAVTRKVTPAAGKLLSLLNEYQNSDDFRSRQPSTKRSYIPLIKRIEKAFGDFPLSAMPDRRTRGIFMAWRDQIAANSGRRQADYAWSVLARILSWGLDRGKITANPCTHGGRLYRGSRVENIWNAADEAAFLKSATCTSAFALAAGPLDRAAPGRPSAPALVCLRRLAHQAAAAQDRTPRCYPGGRAVESRPRYDHETQHDHFDEW